MLHSTTLWFPVGWRRCPTTTPVIHVCRQQQGLIPLDHLRQSRRHVEGGHIVFLPVLFQDHAQQTEILHGQHVGHGLRESSDSLVVDHLRRRELKQRDLLLCCALDGVEESSLSWCDERDRPSRATRTPRATDAMDVGLGVMRDIEVDHVADAIDVEATGGDIGGHENVQFALLDLIDGLFPLPLGHLAAEGGTRITACFQLLGQLCRHRACADEDENTIERLRLEDACEGIDLVLPATDHPMVLGDRVGDGRSLFDGDVFGVA